MVYTSEAIQESDIPAKIIKENVDFLQKLSVNTLIIRYTKLNLKLENTTTVFKKVACTSENRYRPVSVLSVLFKLIERLFNKQVSGFLKASY